MLIILIGVPASILGAESVKHGMRSRLARRVELVCIVACMVGVVFSAVSFHLVLVALLVYNVAIMADSGALTAGAVEVATPDAQGATLAIYTLVGFVGAAIGPLAVGTALDFGGGFRNAHAWYFGFAAMGAGSVLAAIAMSALSAFESRAGILAGGQSSHLD
jgi:MFS family permease